MANDKIKVEIKCWEKVQYWQQVEMTQEEFDKLELLNGGDVTEREDPAEYSILNAYINPQNVTDSEHSFTDFEIEKVTKP